MLALALSLVLVPMGPAAPPPERSRAQPSAKALAAQPERAALQAGGAVAASGGPSKASTPDGGAAQPLATDGGADQGEVAVVLALLERQRQAWNAGDLPGFCAIYAEDARFLSPSGVTQGRAAVLARYQQRYPDKAAMGTLGFEVLEARSTRGTVSIAARWTLSFPGKSAASGHTLIVFNLLPEGWRLVQDASM